MNIRPLKCPSCGASIDYEITDDILCGRCIYKCEYCRSWVICDYAVKDGQVEIMNEAHDDSDGMDMFMKRLFDGNYYDIDEVKR